MCSDEVLRQWCYFFHCCECLGTWASQLEFFAFYLQAKPQGGFRTIALLADPIPDLGEGENEDSEGMGYFNLEGLFRSRGGQIHGRCHRAAVNDS